MEKRCEEKVQGWEDIPSRVFSRSQAKLSAPPLPLKSRNQRGVDDIMPHMPVFTYSPPVLRVTSAANFSLFFYPNPPPPQPSCIWTS